MLRPPRNRRAKKLPFTPRHDDPHRTIPPPHGPRVQYRPQVEHLESRVAPSAGKIAFTSYRDGNSEIYVMNADGTGQINLTNNAAASDKDPSWSPDGGKIAFVSDRTGHADIYVMNADGTSVTPLSNDAAVDTAPSWSADGAKIAFSSNRVSGNIDIYVMNADGSNVQRITTAAGPDINPSWSPDGAKLVYDANPGLSEEIFAVNSDGSGSPSQLTSNASFDGDPAYSPAGNKIVFESTRDGNSEIYVMNADGTGQTNLTHHAADDTTTAWSPDGSQIAFSTDRTGAGHEIWIMSMDGSNPVQLTNGAVNDFEPIWVAVSPAATTTVAIDGAGNLIVTDIAAKNDTLTISRDSNNLRVRDPNNPLAGQAGTTQIDAHTVEVPLTNVTGNVQVLTGAGDDLLNVDCAGGNPIPNGGIRFDGGPNGAIGDKLAVAGGAFGLVTHNPTEGHSGNLVLAGFGTISYSGLEPVDLTGSTIADLVFNLTAAADDALLEDDGVSGNGMSQLRSNNGAFELTTFSNPTGSLTINTGAGDDTFTITALPDFNASLTINGDGNTDRINLNASVALGSGTSSGDLAFSAENIALSGNVNTNAGAAPGSIAVSATVGIRLGADVALDADRTTGADGNISLSGPINADAAANNRTLTLTAGDGTILVGNNVGATAALRSFSIASASAATVGRIDTRFGGISLTAAAITLNGNLSTNSLATAGALTVSGAVSLGANVILSTDSSATDGALTIGGPVDGDSTARSLNLQSGNADIFLGVGIGVASPLGSLTAAGRNVTLAAIGGANPGVTGNVQVTSNGGTATLNGGNLGDDLTVSANAIQVNTATISTAGAVSLTAVTAVNVNAGLTAGTNSNVLISGIAINLATASSDLAASGTGVVNITATQSITLAADASITFANGSVTLIADNMDLNAASAINAGAQIVALRPFASGTVISLGGADATDTLGLTDAEIGCITAGTLILGDTANSGAIQLQSPIDVTDAPAIAVLSLRTGGVITDNTVGEQSDIVANALDLQCASLGNIGAGDLNLAVAALTTNTAAANGNQFVSEADIVSVSSIDAGSGVIQLNDGAFTLAASDVLADVSSLDVSGATLALGAFSDCVAGVILTAGSITGTTGTLTSSADFDVRSGAITASLAGSVGLNKSTAAAVTLSGACTFTGAVRVQQGTLIVNGEIGAGSQPVKVETSATLAGQGVIGRAVTVNSGGILAPGSSPGLFNTNNLNLNVGAIYTVDLNGPYATAGADYDQTNVAGSVIINDATLNLVGGAVSPTPGAVLTIIDNDGADPVTGTFFGLPEGSTVSVGAFTAIISYMGGSNSNDVTLSMSGPVSFTETSGGADFILRRNNNGTPANAADDLLQLLRNSVIVESSPLTSATSFTLHGQVGGSDSLTVDFNFGGFFALPSGVFFAGGVGAGSDKLLVIGGGFTSVAEFLTGPGAGFLVFDDGVDPTARITHSDLESSDISGTTIGQLAFNLPDQASPDGDQAFLEDDGVPGNSISQIRSGNSAFELTTFANPVASLTVNAGGGADNVTVGDLSDLNATLIIDGQGGSDVITVSASLTLDAAAATYLSMSAENISLDGAAISTAGDQTYHGAVALAGDAMLTSTGGSVTFADTVDGPHSLIVSATGDVSFLGSIGATTTLISLAVNLSANISLLGSAATLAGIQLLAQDQVIVNDVNAGAGPVHVAANQDGAGSEGFTQNSGAIVTANDTADAVAIAVNRSAGGAGSADLRAISAGTIAGRIFVAVHGGAINDADGGPAQNLTAAQVALWADAGIGAAADPLETAVRALEALANVGGLFVSNAGDLLVGGVTDSLNGVNVVSSGDIALNVAGALHISAVADVVTTANGNVTLSADDMAISQSISAAGTAAGIVTLQQFDTTPHAIDLGGAIGGGALGLNDAELDQVTANILRVGRTDNPGDIHISALISLAHTATLSLRTGGAILDENDSGASLDLRVANLALQTATGIDDYLDLDVGALAAMNSGFGAISLTQDSGNPLTIGLIDGVSGVQNYEPLLDTVIANDADITVNHSITTHGPLDLIVANHGVLRNNAALVSSSAVVKAGVLVAADHMALENGTIVAPRVILVTNSGVGIDLGSTTDSAAALELSDPELDTIAANVLQIGTLSVIGPGFGVAINGDLAVTDAINLVGSATLDLETGGDIVESGYPNGGSIAVPHLAIRAANSVIMDQANDVLDATLAAVVSGAGQGFTFTDVNDMAIGSVDGLDGVTTLHGAIVVLTFNGSLTVNQNVNAGVASIDLAAGGSANTLANCAVVSNAGDNPITLLADRMVLAGGSSVFADDSGRVILEPSSMSWAIDVGSITDTAPDTLELSAVELDTLCTTGFVQLGSNLTAAIAITDAMTPTSFNGLALVNGGAITQSDIIGVDRLRITSSSSVTLDDANAVDNLAISGSAAGASVVFHNDVALQITDVDTISGITGTGSADISADGPITIASDVVLAGDVALTAEETADEPICANTLTVNSHVAVQSTSGNVSLNAGDDVILESGSSVIAAKNLALNAGFTNLDNCGDLIILSPVALSAGNNLDICVLGDLFVTGFAAGGTVSLRSHEGAIIDDNPAGPDVTASALALEAKLGIGVGDSLDTAVANLEAKTETGGVFVCNTGDMMIGAVTPGGCVDPLPGVRVTVSGAIGIEATGSLTLADPVAAGGDAGFTGASGISNGCAGLDHDINLAGQSAKVPRCHDMCVDFASEFATKCLLI
jgi:autotransporter-associated beta strand protein